MTSRGRKRAKSLKTVERPRASDAQIKGKKRWREKGEDEEGRGGESRRGGLGKGGKEVEREERREEST